MKQFSFCLGFTILLYFLASIVGSTFNPFKWGDGTKFLLVVGFLMCWIVPVFVNYLNGDKNFE